ncbi:transcription antitermination factor NusB [Paludisphaera rhizosphaerae]|uniref:transcription antitermination factor NusB n=1 Tax=Paludisphaera rhizosphaerae TaxID=2711216 RepID=UPI00197EA46F|nr:transcription antitermination factor NusB [Paludisphaera rhizosphaerae]
MTRRSRGREVALQVLYQLEQNSGVVTPDVRRFIDRRLLRDRDLAAFTLGLVEGVRQHGPAIDEAIKEVAENWRLDRMAAIDRNILRLGAFEILHRPEVPAKVAINEALELAKRYSTAQSSRFVNGILDKVLQNRDSAEGERPADEAAADPDVETAPEAATPPAAVEEGPGA